MYEARQNKEKVSRRIDGGEAKKNVKITGFSAVTQMMAVIRSGFPDYEYQVNKHDIHRGTETTDKTRDYVNGPNFNGNYYQGGTINLRYEVGRTPINNFTGNAVVITNIPNPSIQIPNRSIWDAGHALPKQIGGMGHLSNHVFPQSPPVNQGNNNANYNIVPGASNFLLWRTYENNFANRVLFSGHGRWQVHIN